MYGLAARAVRISDDGLTYRFTLRPEAKFHDGTPLTAHDVVWSLTTLKEKGHPIITQLLRDFTGAEAADDAPWWCALPKSAAATCRCSSPACRFSRAPIMRRTPFDEIDARHSARQRRLQGRPRRGRPLHRVRARQGLVGRGSAGGAAGQNNFDTCATNIIATAKSAFEGFTGAELSVPRGIHLAHLGDALRFSRLQGRPRQARRSARRDAVGRARLVHQYAARASSRTAACARR